MNTEPKTIEEFKASLAAVTSELATAKSELKELKSKFEALELKSHQDDADAEEIQRRRKFKQQDDGGDRPAFTRGDFGGGR